MKTEITNEKITELPELKTTRLENETREEYAKERSKKLSSINGICSEIFSKSRQTMSPGEKYICEIRKKELEDYLPIAEEKMKCYLKQHGYDKYIDNKKILEEFQGVTKILMPTEMKKFYDGKWDESINGFYKEDACYINAKCTRDNGGIETIYHENFHRFSSNYIKYGNTLKEQSGTMINRAHKGFNEALTQRYTLELLGEYESKIKSTCAYTKTAKLMDKFYQYGNNKDIFDKAYFLNQPELLEEHFDGICGKGFYNKLCRSFDKAIYYNSTKALDKIDAAYKEYKKCGGDKFG